MSEKVENGKFEVLYEDNEGCNEGVMSFNSEEEAEEAIEADLEEMKMKFFGNYDYGDFGRKTEIWKPGDSQFASWTRLWEKEN